MSKKLVKLGATIFLIITLFSQVCIPFIYADEVGDQTMKIEIEKKELDKTDTMKNVEYLENQWLIGYLNKDGNIEMYTSIGREKWCIIKNLGLYREDSCWVYICYSY